MKKLGKCMMSLLLAAALLCGLPPAALALDADPPMYEQFGFASADEFMLNEGFYRFEYDMAADHYRRHLEEIRQNPQIALDYWGLADLAELDEEVDQGYWSSRDDFYQRIALWMAMDDEAQWTPPLSVQLNGEKLVFPDAQPETANGRTMVPLRAMAEALDAEVRYERGSVTLAKDDWTLQFSLGQRQIVWQGPEGAQPEGFAEIRDSEDGAAGRYGYEMDVPPYEKGGRAYVPVRFFAEALGLTVRWDEYMQTAVVYDPAALAAEVDERFSVVNRWLAAQPVNDPEQAMRTAATISMTYTALNSIDGDESYPMDGTLSVISQGESVELELRFDLYLLARLFAEDNEWLMGAPFKQAVEDLKDDLTNARFEMIYNADTNVLYFRCPLLIKAIAAAEPGVQIKTDPETWFSAEDAIDSGMFSLLDSCEEMRKGGGMTVGAILTAQEEASCAEYGGYSELWYQVRAMADSIAEYAADDQFTRSGSRYTAKLERQSPFDDGGYHKSTYTLDTRTGEISGSYETREKGWNSDTLTTGEFTADAARGRIKIKAHEKNTSITEVTIELTQKPSAAGPAAQPPEGDQVLDFEKWLDKLLGYEEAGE
ncbi:MAG: copper amine oxidase N-terminal domain-containing protein [Eubacteriales bacterium]|nr:copper amine oxidase N-terminal domain-containing protein [Eubacteriales bacterium]